MSLQGHMVTEALEALDGGLSMEAVGRERDGGKFAQNACTPEAHQCLQASVCVSCSVMSDSVTSWTTAHQALLSMEFSRQEYWSGLPFPSPGDRPNPGVEPTPPALRADSFLSEPSGKSP